MKIATIEFDKETQCIRFMSPESSAPKGVIGEIVLTGVVVESIDELATRIGRFIFGLLENATGSTPIEGHSFGRELDEWKIKRIERLEEMANQGDPDALFEIFSIYFAVGVRNCDQTSFSLAESYLERAIKRGSKKASNYASSEWQQVRALSIEHIKNSKKNSG
jgi:hypothetical protein